MKRLSFLTMLVFFSVSLCAQNEVPAEVKRGFAKKFPDAKSIKWLEPEDEGEFETSFKLDRQKMLAKFDTGGNWMETEFEIRKDNLPSAVKLTISVEFAEYEIDSAEQLSTPERSKAYEVTLEGAEHTLKVIFTASGEVLEKDIETE